MFRTRNLIVCAAIVILFLAPFTYPANQDSRRDAAAVDRLGNRTAIDICCLLGLACCVINPE